MFIFLEDAKQSSNPKSNTNPLEERLLKPILMWLRLEYEMNKKSAQRFNNLGIKSTTNTSTSLHCRDISIIWSDNDKILRQQTKNSCQKHHSFQSVTTEDSTIQWNTRNDTQGIQK